MARRNDHTREELEQMIVIAARDLIRTKGLQGFSMRAVAGAIGYTVGTLYLIFENIDDLLYAVNARTVAALRRAMESAIAEQPDAADRLSALAHCYLRFALDHPNLWRCAFEHAGKDPLLVPEIAAETDRILRLAAAAFADLEPSLDASGLTTRTAAFWSGIHGICHLTLTDKMSVATRRPATEILDNHIAAYCPPALAATNPL